MQSDRHPAERAHCSPVMAASVQVLAPASMRRLRCVAALRTASASTATPAGRPQQAWGAGAAVAAVAGRSHTPVRQVLAHGGFHHHSHHHNRLYDFSTSGSYETDPPLDPIAAPSPNPAAGAADDADQRR